LQMAKNVIFGLGRRGTQRHLAQYAACTELMRSVFRFPVLSQYCIPTVRPSCRKVTCHASCIGIRIFILMSCFTDTVTDINVGSQKELQPTLTSP
jgi:hypothetical protein